MESFAVTDMTAITSAVLFRSDVRAVVSTPMNALDRKEFLIIAFKVDLPQVSLILSQA